MRSSTSSSERLTAADRPGVAQPVPVRPVPEQPWLVIIACAFALLVASVAGWEAYWRAQGAVPGFRDDEALWSIQRRRIDDGEGDATVLIGASRTFFDLQLPAWEKAGGRRPIQLALDGTSPLFALEDLANDPLFKGRLLVGIAPDIYFTGFEYKKSVKDYVRKESPSQRVGKWLSMRVVEPWFAFYDPDYALFTVFRRQPWPDRPGAENGLRVRKLSVTDADRNNHMWRRLESDAAYAALMQRTWASDFGDIPDDDLAGIRKTQDEHIARTAAAVDKLRKRGVPVVFVRDPSISGYLSYEERWFPRATTWDVLLERTGAPGIHFQDYPELQGYDLPEWSHMTTESAERYTAALYAIIDRQLGGSERW